MARQDIKGKNRTRKPEVTGDKASDRDAKGKFLPGNKHGGRPKEYRHFRLRCQEFMDEKGWTQLEELANTRGRSQIHALELIAAYAYGRPPQEVKMGGNSKVKLEVVYGNGNPYGKSPIPDGETI